jgi:hypothetical protein
LPAFPVAFVPGIAGQNLRVLMPIFKYFMLTGSVLLALLFVADIYLPPPPNRSDPVDVDRTIIRIRSGRTLPEKIVLDTTHPPVVAMTVPVAPDEPADRKKEALAMMSNDAPPLVKPPQSSANRAVESRRAVRAPRAIRRTPERRLAAEHPDLFGGW